MEVLIASRSKIIPHQQHSQLQRPMLLTPDVALRPGVFHPDQCTRDRHPQQICLDSHHFFGDAAVAGGGDRGETVVSTDIRDGDGGAQRRTPAVAQG